MYLRRMVPVELDTNLPHSSIENRIAWSLHQCVLRNGWTAPERALRTSLSHDVGSYWSAAMF